MLLLTIGLWFVVVLSFRVVLFGNPLYRQLVHADRDLLAGVEEVVNQEKDRATEDEMHFLRRFSRLTLLELAAFLLEIALLFVLYAMDVLIWLTVALLVKNALLLIVSALVARRRTDHRVLAGLVDLPGWLIWSDRASALLSGVGCFLLFLAVNGIKPW